MIRVRPGIKKEKKEPNAEQLLAAMIAQLENFHSDTINLIRMVSKNTPPPTLQLLGYLFFLEETAVPYANNLKLCLEMMLEQLDDLRKQ